MVYQGVLVALASAVLGSVSALASHIARRQLARRIRRDAVWQFSAVMTSLASFGLGFPGLMYLAALDRTRVPIIVIAWMAGTGLMRRHLREI
jgi:hypothetical protein